MENDYNTRTPKVYDFAFIKLILTWVIAISLAFSLHHFVFQSFQVFGASMEPTLHQGDYLIISKVGPSWADLRGKNYVPDRGDIVVVDTGGVRLIKRVIGLPGETVVVTDGEVKIYTAENPEGFDPYQTLNLPPVYASGDLRVDIPSGEVFVIGDNRQDGNSLDSRNQLGTVPTEDIIGSLVFRLWPPRNAEIF